MSEPRILVIDIETMAAKAYVWGLFNQNIGIQQVIEPDRMICFAAKWADEKNVMFFSEWQDGHRVMTEAAFELLDEADIVCWYNGDRFDGPWLQRTFEQYKMGEPSSFYGLDLYKVLKKRTRFLSHKLAWITEQLELSGKLKHDGFEMWRAVDNPRDPQHPKYCRMMERYCKRDVKTTDELRRETRHLQTSVPHAALYNDEDTPRQCPTCKSDRYESRGYAYTKTRKYPRYHCLKCGRWFKGNRSVKGVTET